MRRLVVFAALFFGMVAQVSAQDTDPQEFSKWRARFRLISIIPNTSDNLPAGGGEVDISTAFVPELDFTYFFNKNISAELILGTARHDVKVEAAPDLDLGHVWLLPPTLNLQYHFYAGNFKPYVGAGINYTIFYGIDEGAVEDMDYDNSVSASFQLGFDYDLNDKLFLNLDAKYLTLGTDVTVNAGGGTILPVEVDINPLIVGLGIGIKF